MNDPNSHTSSLLADAAQTIAPTRPEDFLPRRFLRNRHLQTLAGNFWPRRYSLPPAEAQIVQVEGAESAPLPPGSPAADQFAQAEEAAHTRGASHILCHCNWQPDAGRRLTVVLLHGLEGSSRSQYMLGNAARAWAAGCNVVRMNMRNCGGTEHLSPTLYHSGLSADVAAVIRRLASDRQLDSFALVGYSMGGNLVLKLAGEVGDAPGTVKAVVGISPAMDLAASADALHRASNRVYEWKFLRGLRRRFRRKAQLFPALYSTAGLEKIATLRQFDDQITARYSGFEGADDYYYRASSARKAAEIIVPTLIVHSLDDPFVRMLPPTRSTLLANPQVRLVETAHGGHCAFLASSVEYDGYWAEKSLLDFLLSVTAS